MNLTPCPSWCTSSHTGSLPGAAYHRATWRTPPRFLGTLGTIAVTLSMELPDDGEALDPGPQIALATWFVDVPPLGLTIREARALADSLNRAADLAAEHLPDVCTSCGEPCQATQHAGKCMLCAFRDGALAGE